MFNYTTTVLTEDACPSICIFQFRKIISRLQTQLECEVYSESCWMYLIVRVGLGPGFESLEGQLICSSPKPSIPTLRPNQHPIQWVPVFLLRGKAARVRSWPLTSNAEVKTSRTLPLLLLHVFMLGTGTTVLLFWISAFFYSKRQRYFPLTLSEHGLQTNSLCSMTFTKLACIGTNRLTRDMLMSLTHFYFHYTRKDCSRFLCHWPLSMHSNEALHFTITCHFC